ncbi:MAG: PIG-L deacetylase family protein [Gaiellaceae bacterium]
MPSPTGSTAVISPHLDDAALSCWSLLTDENAAVVNVFAGVPASGVVGEWDRVVGSDDGASLVAERRCEDRAALATTQCKIVCLDFVEPQYGGEDADADVASAIVSVLNDSSELVVPAGIGGHPDHLHVRAVGLRLAAAAHVPVRLYAELPYAAAFGWPNWVSGASVSGRLDVDAYWDLFLKDELWNWRRLKRDVRRLGADERAAKVACLERYETQFPLLNGGPLERLRNPAIIGFEVFLTVPTNILPSQASEPSRSRLRRLFRLQEPPNVTG